MEIALEAERAAQAKRLAALGECEKQAARERAKDIADIERDIEDVKRQFEELQQALKEEVAKQLEAIDKFNKDYNDKWAEAMKALESYLKRYSKIMPDNQKIWEQFGNREWAREVAGWVDTAIQAALAGVDIVHAGQGLLRGVATEAADAARVATRGALREEALGARAASSLERGAASGAEREASRLATRGAREEGELGARAASKAEREAAQSAEEKASQLAHEREIDAALDSELAAARAEREATEKAAAERAAREAPGPQDPLERQEAIQNSGMVPDHSEAMSGVAMERDEIVMTQATNKSATSNIADGAATKNMHIKGKSADSGPAEGYIPVDQSLSRKVADPSPALIEQQGSKEKVLEHFNNQVKQSIDEGYAIPKEIIGKDGTKVTVLADPTTGLPITADYDLLAVGTKKPQMLQVPDHDLGNITAGGRGLKDEINHSVVGPNRDVNNPVVHHGPANEAPVNPGTNYPVTAHEPSGNIISIPKGPPGNEDLYLKQYFNSANQRGYHVQPHPDWGWTRGENFQWQ